MGDLTNPSPVLEIAIGTIGLVIVMIFHGLGVRFINRRYSAVWVKVDAATPHWRVNLLLVLVIAAFAVVHLVETLIWAVPIHRLGMIPNLRDSYYYVLESYTTLGEGAVTLPEQVAAGRADHRDVGALHLRLDRQRARRHHDRVRPARPQPRPPRRAGRTAGAEPEA